VNIPGLQVDASRPLGEQLHLLGAQGLDVSTTGGVLTIRPIE
jgi:hypothetical protein